MTTERKPEARQQDAKAPRPEPIADHELDTVAGGGKPAKPKDDIIIIGG